MNQTVVIDKDVLGNLDEKELSKRWKKILKVGTATELPQRSFDEEIATYCREHDCDLLTGDKAAYTHYFRAKVKALQISEYTWLTRADKPVYLIQIID